MLDIGCNAGFYSLEMKRRGAARVVGIDSDAGYLAQARFAAEVTRRRHRVPQAGRVRRRASCGEQFDIVLFMGVLYHLRHPLLALDLLYEHVVGDTLVFQSLHARQPRRSRRSNRTIRSRRPAIFEQPGYPLMYFVEKRYSHDPTNWWIPESRLRRGDAAQRGLRDRRSSRRRSLHLQRRERRRARG